MDTFRTDQAMLCRATVFSKEACEVAVKTGRSGRRISITNGMWRSSLGMLPPDTSGHRIEERQSRNPRFQQPTALEWVVDDCNYSGSQESELMSQNEEKAIRGLPKTSGLLAN